MSTSIPACCRTGFEWNGSPTGREATIANNKTYITGSSSRAAIILVHDIFGWTLPNSRLLADHFAKEADATVYLPDFFGGEILPQKELLETLANFTNPAKHLVDIPAFAERNSKAIRGPELVAVAQALRETYPRIGAVGYCFGGWACFQLAAQRSPNPLVDVISVAHPSNLEESEIDNLAVPTQIIAPEHDFVYTAELKAYSNKKIPELGIPYQYDYYPGVAHGFAVKGDPSDPKQKAALERAKNAVVAWFKEHL